jgi:dienelactone hydrolase
VVGPPYDVEISMKKLIRKWAIYTFGVFGLAVYGQSPEVQKTPLSISRAEIKVPMSEAGEMGLQTYLILPSTPGKHPVVLMTHGSDYSKGKNQQMSPGLMQPQAIWFARRGWVVAIVARRGYGASGGKMDKTHYGCDESAFATIAEEDAKDLTAAYNSVKDLRQVDSTRVIATGNSTGGFASLALGAYAVPGLKAVINFSGGWHSMFFSGSCTKSGLVPEFRALGAATHVPTLWLYAKNDSLFGPKYVAQVYEAFTSAGGEAELPALGKSGSDGHYLFSESVEMWEPLVEDFLAKHDLPSRDLDPQQSVTEMKLPNNFPSDMKDAFAKFMKLGPNKAFAVGPNGEWSYSVGRKTLKIAKDDALDRCRNPQCQIIAYEGK